MGIMDNSYDEWLSNFSSDDNVITVYSMIQGNQKLKYRNGMQIISPSDLIRLKLNLG